MEQWLDRWYLGVFLVIFGATLVLRARHLANLRRFFKRSGRPEILAAVDRRMALEALPLWLWTAPGAVSIVLGVIVLLALMPGSAAYSICACAFAASLGFGYLQMRNRGERRAAVLEPRSATGDLPMLWYPIAIVQVLAPLAFIGQPNLAFASACVALGAAFSLVVTCAANAMPSILTGEDIESELFVDRRLRSCRVKGLYGVTMGIPFVFVCMNYTALESPVVKAAYAFAIAAWIVTTLPWILHIRLLPGPKESV